MANSRKRLKVLIVDDDITFLCDMTVLLSSDFEIMSASNTRDALLMIEEFRPDCMLLDIDMPSHFGNDPATEGYDFLEHLESTVIGKKNKDMNIIVVSNTVPEDQPEAVHSSLVYANFTKPPDLEILKEKIRSSFKARS